MQLTAFNLLHQRRDRIPRHGLVLPQPRHPQPGVQQRLHNLAHAMAKLGRLCMLKLVLVMLHIRSPLVKHGRLPAALKVRVLHHELILRLVIDAPQDRVALADEEAPAGLQQTRDDVRPARDVGDPADGADAGEDEVKGGGGEHGEGVVDGGFDKGEAVAAGGGRQRGELAGFGEGGCRKVEARDRGGAKAGEGERVRRDVALEVHGAEACYVTEEGDVEADDIGEVAWVLNKVLDVVVRRGGMLRGRVFVSTSCSRSGGRPCGRRLTRGTRSFQLFLLISSQSVDAIAPDLNFANVIVKESI